MPFQVNKLCGTITKKIMNIIKMADTNYSPNRFPSASGHKASLQFPSSFAMRCGRMTDQK